ncbi:hypothetical protein COY90_00405 [Candidatus Roizmanbacteria bacterium CG_4_10_14_0_8_um_filter_39_9]|uniref:Membrane insertase YidC/Oxa/ALB C-terminal domain-containing protein n=1 Tax=Candidatus Roizmanbacteria bacterium CG_4_10_14_0_8_um_filter_39_9 TaxID=1974829 RepID=A0A2M7QF04_9BACT|nr:MAG: hypothetical protein COY90_00405 [Candidatus Roizmanbacteria bacterium CG_4_10_14_0_8_um_filter_39_9]
MLQPNIFNTFLVIPILNVLMGFNKLFELVHLPGALGFSIVALTLSVRGLLHPFFKQQMDTARKMQEIKPHLDKLGEKHKKDAKKLQEEQLKLYQEAGINPAAGCLFMVVQIPIFIALYQTLGLFFTPDIHKVILAINKVLYLSFLHVKAVDLWFLGLNLATTPQKAHNILYYAIPIITAALQYLQVQTSAPSMGMQTAAKVEDSKKPSSAKALAGEEKKDGVGGDFQKAMNTQMKYIFPLMIGWFSLSMPVGLSLYWNIFSLFSIIQYKQMGKKK